MPPSPSPDPSGFPNVAGTCPACGSHGSLFLGSGNFVTCSWAECPGPTAVADMLDRRPASGASQSYEMGFRLTNLARHVRRAIGGQSLDPLLLSSLEQAEALLDATPGNGG